MDFSEIQSKDGFFINHYIIDGATTSNYDVIYTAHFPCEVLAVTETHRVKGTDGSAVTLNLEKLTSGTALDGGSTMLKTAFDLKSTINIPVYKSGFDLVTTADSRKLVRGDRLALKDVGTPTAVAGVQVTVYLKRLDKGDYL